MNAETQIVEQTAASAANFGRLVGECFAPMAPLRDKTSRLIKALSAVEKIGDKVALRGAEQLRAKLAAMEASVTMIGQVKAGKTSLVNAMVGRPALLPADVNPWTSVVTSLHLDPLGGPSANQARFRFFEKDEWDRLVVSGGRVGELAGRAGAADELEKVRQQIAEMQEKSRARLGRKFELLLGQQHNYGYFDSELIERYVCLGDDFEDDTETSQDQGRFADITKSAEIFMHCPELPVKLCIRDTPGVNDTFMMREQITIRSIRNSRICVVVLSAHQALSSVDMALIRLIANVKSREVIIFVNRVDELADPARQVPEISESIRATLRDHHGPQDAQIIFGSAYWGNNALTDQVAGLARDSAKALVNWAEAELARRNVKPKSNDEVIWELSGIPALYAALSERINENIGRETVDAVGRTARNLIASIKTTDEMLQKRSTGAPPPPLDRLILTNEFRRIEVAGRKVLDAEFGKLTGDFGGRVDRSHLNFLERATNALIAHLENYGEDVVWKYDPTGLRLLLRSAYQLFAKRAQDLTGKVLAATSGDIAGLYERYQLVSDPAFKIEPPANPRIPSPVLLGQTIALDLQANWWSRWWRKQRGYQNFANEFADLIHAETAPIADGLINDHALVVRTEAITVFSEFLKEQFSILSNIAERGDLDQKDMAKIFGVKSEDERRRILQEALKLLEGIAVSESGGR